MTLERDPNSIHGAWHETGRQLGWQALGEACGVSAKQAQNWANPNIHPHGPPKTAIDIGDNLLKEAGAPMFNYRATGYRLGERPSQPVQILREIQAECAALVRQLGSVTAKDWNPKEFGEALADVQMHLGIVTRHATMTTERIIAEREAARQEAAARSAVPFPGQARLRTVGGTGR